VIEADPVNLLESELFWQFGFTFPDSRFFGHLPAATVAALLGEDYERAAPKARKPIDDLIAH
jgi:hypothetical protein